MAETFYLVEHPPARAQYRAPRRGSCSGVVVMHSAENYPDVTGPDTGAEAVAGFIARRDTPGSYHDLADSDSALALIPWAWEAFHDGTGTNPHSVGLSAAWRADDLPGLLVEHPRWVEAVVDRLAERAAGYARWLRSERGVVIPARRITVAEARAGRPGFVTHGELDPGRRHDPASPPDRFPWDRFFRTFTAHQHGGDDTMSAADVDELKRYLDERLAPIAEAAAGAAFLAQLAFDMWTPNGFAYIEPKTRRRVPKGTPGARPAFDVHRWAGEAVEADRLDDDRHRALVELLDDIRTLVDDPGGGPDPEGTA